MARTIVRTPRKRKVWSEAHSIYTVTGSIPFVVSNLLVSYENDLGVSYLQGCTIMAARGKVTIVELANATSPAIVDFHLGMVWVPQAIASASVGDSQIPEPGQQGVREDRWYHEFDLKAYEAASAISGHPAEAASGSRYETYEFETRNMQKQPTVNHQFCLIGTTGGTQEASTLGIQYDISLLLGLA